MVAERSITRQLGRTAGITPLPRAREPHGWTLVLRLVMITVDYYADPTYTTKLQYGTTYVILTRCHVNACRGVPLLLQDIATL